jgi:hypothetical protein
VYPDLTNSSTPLLKPIEHRAKTGFTASRP